jgi:hypothetical protein
VSLYTDCVAAGLKIDSHESDLYIKDGYEARKLVVDNGKVTLMKEFVSEIDGKPWIEVPFAYDPYWEKKVKNDRDNQR